ncbi:MAG: class I SAM-dependent methyltransferase [Blastocatellia bacterium]|nr:class I SAM-dependent methyltransferase [Blastocatellia bacterium]
MQRLIDTGFDPGTVKVLREDRALAELRRVVDEALAIDRSCNQWPDMYHNVVKSLYDLFNRVFACERAGFLRQEILEHLNPVRESCGRSEIFSRLQNWPRGYPGDFETIEYMCEARNQAEKETLAYCYEEFALRCPPSQQHRNRVQYQSELILDTLLNSSRPASVLSIACGSGRDLRAVQNALKGTRGRIALNDADPEAIAFLRSKLESSGEICEFHEGNILHLIGEMEQKGPFNLVLAGSLLDYLSDRQAIYLIANVTRRLLKPGGKFYFSNIAGENPYRAFMEYLTSWILRERSEERVLSLCAQAGVERNSVEIRREETGLALMVEVATRVRHYRL